MVRACWLLPPLLQLAGAASAGEWDASHAERRAPQPQSSDTLLTCSTPPTLSALPEKLPPEIDSALAAARTALDKMWASSKAVGGTAVIVYDDRVLLTHTFGSLSAATARPLDGSSILRIGSVTKVFTNLLMHRLAEEGLLSEFDPITTLAPTYKPAWPGAPATSRGGTLRDLASHMAGLPRGLPCDTAACNITTAEAIDIMNHWSLLAEPGTKLTYSNVGFALLGRLLERVASPTKPKVISFSLSVR